jgi:ribosomal protein S5
MKDNRNNTNNQQQDALEEKLVQVNRVAKVVKVEESLDSLL